jgi:hypothetical protein
VAAGALNPLGAYIGKQGQVRFDPNLIGLILVATPFVWVTGKALKASSAP